MDLQITWWTLALSTKVRLGLPKVGFLCQLGYVYIKFYVQDVGINPMEVKVSPFGLRWADIHRYTIFNCLG